MKILAIRGANLTSLAGPFELALDQSPLAEAGLFAITGRTGAGKSTLLDALCLALYDRIPRLSQASGVRVGAADEDDSQRLASNDPRSILRRGTASGYAEVDFVGVDGGVYRARWEVRRARNKPDGKLQNQSLSLRVLGSEQLLGGSNKTDVLPLIADKLGLTFDQFRRAVLLAQGEFAAFLKANSKENSELLERITGTEIYSELSKAAHDRDKAERVRLTELERQLADLQPLADAERAALEHDYTLQQTRKQRADADVREAQQVLNWHQQLDKLHQAEQSAEHALSHATHAQREAAPRRERLAEALRAQPLKPQVEHFEAAEHAATAADTALAEADQEANTRVAQARHCAAALEQAQAQFTAIQAAITAARAELAQARDLDARLHTQSEQLANTSAQTEQAAAAAHTAASALAALDREREPLQAELARHITWLTAHPALATLAEQWARWEQVLHHYAAAAHTRSAAEQALAQLTGQLRVQEQILAAAEAERQQQQSALTAAQARYAACTQSPAADLSALRQERLTLEKTQQRQQALYSVLRDWLAAEQERQTAQTAAADCHRQAEQAAVTVADQTRHSETVQAALTEAERAERAALTACNESVTHLRAQLVDGEACPVCGALEHPWAHAAPLMQLLDAQQARVADLRQQRLAIEQTRMAAQTTQQQAAARATDHQDRAARAANAQTRLNTRWAELCAEDPAAAVPPQPVAELEAALAAEIVALAERRQYLQEREATALAQAEALTAARRALDDQRAHLEQASTAYERERQALETLRATQRAQQSAQQQARIQQEREQAELAVPFAAVPDWQSALATDPAGFRSQWAAQVANWRDHEAARQRLEHELHTLAGRRQLAASDATRHAETAADWAEQHQTQTQALERLRAERQQCFAGRAVTAVESEQERARSTAEHTLEQARTALHTAEQMRVKAEQSVAHCRAEAERRRREKAAAAEKLNREVAASGLDPAQLPALFALAAGQLAAEQQALAALDRARDDAYARLDLCREQRQRHAAEQPPALSAEAAAVLLTDAETALTAAQQALAAIHHRLQQDAERRSQSMQVQADLARQRRRADVWRTLDNLIGSSDGKKFRVFAQSLTLDLLVAHANQHLAELARRYRLERVPGSDLDLQIVDNEMGDEIRSVHSLSGGESFLVSLALALGLASLSARRTQVESLFIDEGFGSLDAETLDMALSSLDALQAQGRQVGVISHVGALVERIGVQVRVERLGGGRSRVTVKASGLVWPEVG